VTFSKVVQFSVLIVIALGGCVPAGTQEAPKSASVTVKKVQSEPLFDLLNYPARVNSRVNASILSESNGIITRVLVNLGQKVGARQVLMVLSHTDPVYQYAPVQIVAPIEGIVSAIEVTQGSHVVSGQKLAAVINPSQLEIQVQIPAQDLAIIKKGMSGEFKIQGQEAVLQVQVLGVSPFVDPNTGTALAQLNIVSKLHPVLSPGIQGQVSFQTNLHRGFAIPDSALIYKGADPFVRVLEDHKIKQIPVVLGTKQSGKVEILKGLHEGQDLVERASRFVADGEAVTAE